VGHTAFTVERTAVMTPTLPALIVTIAMARRYAWRKSQGGGQCAGHQELCWYKQARHHVSDPEAARHEHGAGVDRIKSLLPEFAACCLPHRYGYGLRPLESIRDSVNDVKLSRSWLSSWCSGDLPVLRNVSATIIPASPCRFRGGHVRRDGAAGYTSTTLADGADPGGRFVVTMPSWFWRTRPAHGNGQDQIAAAMDGGRKSRSPSFP